MEKKGRRAEGLATRSLPSSSGSADRWRCAGD